VFAVADIADVIMLFSIILWKFLTTKRTVKYDEETMWIKHQERPIRNHNLNDNDLMTDEK
jgi:hypothetical protein